MSDIKFHPVHEDIDGKPFDVFIAGSGPIGATYARLLVDRGYSVCMAEVGDVHDGLHPGAHQKNEIRYQKDIDSFVRVIQRPSSQFGEASITHGRNPMQKIFNNLGAAAITRCVGGMSTHWTCATPEFLKGVERPKIFPNDEVADDTEWKKLYEAARRLIGTSEHEFDRSIRHNTVLDALKNDPRFKDRGVEPIPLACHRINNGPYVHWHSAENIFGKDFFVKDPAPGKGVFRLLCNTLCTKLYESSGEIQLVEVRDLIKAMQGEKDIDFGIKAKVYVIAAGAIATPQILANSGFGGRRSQENDKNVLIPNLGKRIVEHPMAFCQIVLRQELASTRDLLREDTTLTTPQVDNVTSQEHPKWWRDAVAAHVEKFPHDPIKIPVQDPEPQVAIPVSKDFPWRAQIHRDAFSYGEASPLVDPRLVVDLRFFGMQKGVLENRIIFEDSFWDAYEMPQATFEYTPTPEFAKQATDMMNDMTNAAHVLGGYLPGSNPQFMTPGLSLHLGGSMRLGHKEEKSESVADYNSLVWDTKNLYVAGNGTIPTTFGANPTLTSMCFAIRSAYSINEYLKSSGTAAATESYSPSTSVPEKYKTPQKVGAQRVDVADSTIKPTPDEWLAWANVDDNRHKNLQGASTAVFVPYE
ncbi:pyranose oxidase [Exidia glandulosa HHB12029]|uniref:Pyranose 2-oxidase n=1 Tax=Exidia glandulosa HHB12029 TaxID=1314781 RepID=A0A165D7S9_EXIGL|nr:pyranose oxidase [Exidia glandulosa HHB12029]